MSETLKSSEQFTKEEECKKIFDHLYGQYIHYLKTQLDDVNTYMVDQRSDKLKDDLNAVIYVCWDVLMSAANKRAPIHPLAYVEDDIVAICVNMFKPFFKSETWITNIHRQNREIAEMIRIQSDLFEYPDGLYCSAIKYLDQLIADSCA